MNSRPIWIAAICILIAVRIAECQDAQIHVDASRDVHRISRLLTGACLEDVNHEIYGGLYSQMIFGETLDSVARRHVAITRAPECQRIDQRLA